MKKKQKVAIFLIVLIFIISNNVSAEPENTLDTWNITLSNIPSIPNPPELDEEEKNKLNPYDKNLIEVMSMLSSLTSILILFFPKTFPKSL